MHDEVHCHSAALHHRPSGVRDAFPNCAPEFAAALAAVSKTVNATATSRTQDPIGIDKPASIPTGSLNPPAAPLAAGGFQAGLRLSTTLNLAAAVIIAVAVVEVAPAR